MPSQLYNNDGISFVAAKPFVYRGTEYAMGEDFPQEEANNIETLVRARFVIPVLEDGHMKPRHWHTHVRTREQAREYLFREVVQLQMPDTHHEVDLETLTDPQRNLAGQPVSEASTNDAGNPRFDPGTHTVNQVRAYMAKNRDDAPRVRAAEAAGRGRKGLLEE